MMKKDYMYVNVVITLVLFFYIENTNVDPDKIDINSKSSYDPRINFIKRLKSYQGIHSHKITQEFLNELDTYSQKI